MGRIQYSMGENIKIISWNVRGVNFPNKRGDASWLLRKFGCDIAILQESKMEDVNRPVVFYLWGRRSMDWLALPSRGRAGGIIVI